MAEELLKKSKREKRKKIKKKKKDEERKKEILEVKSNIDDIFSKIKVKDKSKKADETKRVNDSERIMKNKKKKDKNNVSKKKVGERLHTPDGLPIYTMEELKMGKGGYTKDCPFECNCCF